MQHLDGQRAIWWMFSRQHQMSLEGKNGSSMVSVAIEYRQGFPMTSDVMGRRRAIVAGSIRCCRAKRIVFQSLARLRRCDGNTHAHQSAAQMILLPPFIRAAYVKVVATFRVPAVLNFIAVTSAHYWFSIEIANS